MATTAVLRTGVGCRVKVRSTVPTMVVRSRGAVRIVAGVSPIVKSAA